MRKRIIFHIGLEKTGTTSFQRFCFDNRSILAARGILYPTQSLAFERRNANHAPLVACYIGEGGWVDYDLSRHWRRREDVVASLKSEFRRAEAPTLLLSAEHFSSRFFPRHIERLAEDFGEFDCRIAIVLRAHEARIHSAYSSTIRSGRDVTLEQFVDELLLPDNWYCRYAETIRRWRAVFGDDAVSALPFRESQNVIGALWSDLLHFDGAPPSAKRYFANTDFGASVLETLRRVNEAAPSPGVRSRGELFKHASLSLARSALLRALAISAPPREQDRARIEGAQRAPLKALVDEDCAWLETHAALRLPRMADASVVSGPERPARGSLSFATRFATSLRLWLTH
ncbi:MAG TPA: hypothetical protein VIF40_16020 [Methylosinus sp.]|jgi:hypothetical protein|uniref:hypothetical protein n=1 Tax=Methylosinus sp. TaxID=427 RepID=UPI002F949541